MRVSGALALAILGAVSGCGGGSDAVAPTQDRSHLVQVTSLGDGGGRVQSMEASPSLDCTMGDGAGSCSISLIEGSEFRFQASADSGSEFQGWGLDASSCGTASSCTLTVDRELTIAARFEPVPLAAPSSARSTLSTPRTTLAPGETTIAMVTVKDDQGAPLTGVNVALYSSAVGVSVTPGATATNQTGVANFILKAQQSGSATLTASAGNIILAQHLTLTVSAEQTNQAPVAGDDSFQAAQDQVSSFPIPGVLSNDSDPEGSSLTAQLVTGTKSGTVALNSDGSFSYTPFPQYFGADSFSYKVSDGTSFSNVATVHLTVGAGGQTNGSPVARDDSFEAAQGINQASTFAAPGVLVNDTGPEGSSLTAQLSRGTSFGTVQLNPDGSFSYTPLPLYAGSDSFSYTVTDGVTTSSVATVQLSVIGTEQVPTALCRDGTLSYSAHHSGTCSYHGGVEVWYR
jgi:hypothetical protein